ncbi:MAG: pyridoxamine 5'-phosphate oxidase family protein [bacterium]
MSDKEIERELTYYISKVKYLALATVDGRSVRTRFMEFANDGLTLYAATLANSNKCRQIAENPTVSAIIPFIVKGEVEGDLSDYRTISIDGRAEVISVEGEREEAIKMCAERSPVVRGAREAGRLDDFVIFKIVPQRVTYVKYKEHVEEKKPIVLTYEEEAPPPPVEEKVEEESLETLLEEIGDIEIEETAVESPPEKIEVEEIPLSEIKEEAEEITLEGGKKEGIDLEDESLEEIDLGSIDISDTDLSPTTEEEEIELEDESIVEEIKLDDQDISDIDLSGIDISDINIMPPSEGEEFGSLPDIDIDESDIDDLLELEDIELEEEPDEEKDREGSN